MTDWGLIEENLRLLSDPKVLLNLAKLLGKQETCRKKEA